MSQVRSTPSCSLLFLLCLSATGLASTFPVSAAATQPCTADPAALCLQGRFEARVSWRDPATSATGVANAAPLSSESGYVEPYPELFDRLAALGSQGFQMALELGGAGFEVARVMDWFGGFADTMGSLAQIARKELAHEELTEAERDFLRQTIEVEMVGCGEVHWDGWYGSLFFDRADMGVLKPTIADVHTAPTDEEGNPVGWVLHVATGPAQLALLTIPHGDGARTFVGPVSTYFERLEEQFQRRTDSEWLEILFDEPPARPAWTREFARP